MESSLEMTQKHAAKNGEEIADDIRLQPAPAKSSEVDDTRVDTPRRPLDPSAEADVPNQTNAERLNRSLAMSIMDENDSDEIDPFKAASIEPDEGYETEEQRLQRALAMLK